MTGRASRPHGLVLHPASAALFLPLLISGCALFSGSNRSTAPEVAVSASPVVVAGGGRVPARGIGDAAGAEESRCVCSDGLRRRSG